MSSKVDDEHVTSCTDELNNVHITRTEVVDICANCGKDGGNGLKACTACKLVKYCNRDCQIAHRSKHKKACRKRAAEIRDEELFKQPPPKVDCPICLLPLPLLISASISLIIERKSPFCRAPAPYSIEEFNERLQKRVEVGDAWAINMLGCNYREGEDGFPQDYDKALELYVRAGGLGCAEAYCDVGYAYENGRGVEIDEKKSNHYYKLAAVGGNIEARYNLGLDEMKDGNMDRALKHYMIAAEDGDDISLKKIQELYTNGLATKDDYAKALRAYQAYLVEIKSTQRDKAAAASAKYCYY